jgi:hypothetical protein
MAHLLTTRTTTTTTATLSVNANPCPPQRGVQVRVLATGRDELKALHDQIQSIFDLRKNADGLMPQVTEGTGQTLAIPQVKPLVSYRAEEKSHPQPNPMLLSNRHHSSRN